MEQNNNPQAVQDIMQPIQVCECGGGLSLVKDTVNIYRCDTCDVYHYMQPVFVKMEQVEVDQFMDRVKAVRLHNKNAKTPQDMRRVIYSRPQKMEGEHESGTEGGNSPGTGEDQ